MSLPRGVGSAGRLGEPLSLFPAGVSSELAFFTGYFGEGAAARDVSVINLCKKEQIQSRAFWKEVGKWRPCSIHPLSSPAPESA